MVAQKKLIPLVLALLLCTSFYSPAKKQFSVNKQKMPGSDSGHHPRSVSDVTVQQLWNYSLQPSFSIFAPKVVDLDKDGLLEIVVVHRRLNAEWKADALLSVISSCGEVLWEHIFSLANTPDSPAIADVNNDGYQEIIVGANGNEKLYCFSHNGEILWTYEAPAPISSSPCLADIDTDGFLEILIGTEVGLYCLDNQGVVRWYYYLINNNEVYGTPTVGDFDADNKLEVVFVDTEGDLYLLDYDGSFQWKEYVGSSIYSPRVVDIDNDSRLEIICPGYWSGRISCLNESGDYEWTYKVGVGSGLFSDVVIADIVNADGHPEVIFGSGEDKIHCLAYNGNPLWESDRDQYSYNHPVLADINDDGSQEILFGSVDDAPPHKLFCYSSTGKAGWLTTTGPTGIYDALCIADLDRDGVLELIAPVEAFGIQCFSLSNVTASGTSTWHCKDGSNFNTGSVDSDGDYLDDLTERTWTKTDPLAADADNDSLLDGHEYWVGTNPHLNDTDGDGFTDGYELDSKTDPTKATDYPGKKEQQTMVVLAFGLSLFGLGTLGTVIIAVMVIKNGQK